MTITKDADFPEEAAQLLLAFGACAQEHSAVVTIQAAANLLAWIIHGTATVRGYTPEQMDLWADALFADIRESAHNNLRRKPQPTDIAVKRQ